MSKRGNDAVWNNYYAPFLNGRTAENINIRRTQIIERFYQRILTEWCANRFKWIGLPDTVNPRFLELTLFRNALSVFYFDHEFDKFLSLKGTPNGQWNYEEDPTSFMVTGNSYFTGKSLSAIPRQITVGGERAMKPAECVPIWANYLRYPDIDIVSIFASRLADMDRSIEINAHNARRTKVVITDDNNRMSAVNINSQIDEGSAMVQVSAMGATMLPTSVDMGVDPDAIEKLDIIRDRQWNKCMTLLGIDNANQDKKERLVSDEVSANGEQVNNAKFVNLNARKQAANLINKRYGLNIDVEYNTDISRQMESFIGGEELNGIVNKMGVNAV